MPQYYFLILGQMLLFFVSKKKLHLIIKQATMKTKNTAFLLLIFLTAMLSCREQEQDEPTDGPRFDKTAYRPIYATLNNIETLPPQPLRKPGKIYIRGNILLVNDIGKGIHIIDNKDPKNPQKLSFLKIIGNSDMAVKGNFLYADNASDLVVFDISNASAPKLLKQVFDVIPVKNYPDLVQIYFDCPDATKGKIVGWEKYDTEIRPRCYR
ncbi:MAG: hypothetical protein EAZ32_14405 [Cytophagia bacterium]|nr:MAG: hypothetical protein EAZ38_15415 [Cytophagales bacterium]TAG37758.1 MAG: hypothetical protein EAZ32_14405 [Cytophagia bacterium]TAG70946.1 MAG: hypothetical protein EAZ26_05595 [Runella slithyformis]TAG78941.1 MAG: hypothetical protein EAZ22_12590 [Cytophagales bacterium]